MGKRDRFRDHIDPDYRAWGRKYRKFPGVAECVRLIREGNVRGAQGDIIVWELTENAADCLPELIAAFHACGGGGASMSVLAALELAHLPESAAFFVELLKEGNVRYLPYAIRALRAINTPESRKALWEAANPN